MIEILQTDRLLIREMTEEDASFMLELLNSPGWLEFIGDRKVYTVEQAVIYVQQKIMASYRAHGFGLWLVEFESEPVGACGIIKRPELDHPDLGFAMLPEHMGQGYAIEAAEACANHAGYSLMLPLLLGITMEQNLGARRVLQAAGLEFERLIPWGDGSELMLYKRTFE